MFKNPTDYMTKCNFYLDVQLQKGLTPTSCTIDTKGKIETQSRTLNIDKTLIPNKPLRMLKCATNDELHSIAFDNVTSNKRVVALRPCGTNSRPSTIVLTNSKKVF